MGFHHLVTVYLMIGSYLMNSMEIGAVISFLHDASDISVMGAKAFSQTKYTPVTIFWFINMLLSWGWCRNVMLPFIIYNIYNVASFEKEYITVPIFIYYLSCLAVLHYWWMSIFLKMLYDLIFKGKTED